jgi:hypothetical protein
VRTNSALKLICLAFALLGLIFSGVKSFAQQNSSLALHVIVIPSKTEVHPGETFDAALRVENPAKINQTIRVMNCSWYNEWQSDNPKVSCPVWVCAKNFAVNVAIPPGGAYTNELQMTVLKNVSDRSLKFRLGFTSIGGEKVFWSNPVRLRITPAPSTSSNSSNSK